MKRRCRVSRKAPGPAAVRLDAERISDGIGADGGSASLRARYDEVAGDNFLHIQYWYACFAAARSTGLAAGGPGSGEVVIKTRVTLLERDIA